MHTDVSYGISNLKKYIIFKSLGEKQCVNYGVYNILLTATCCIQLTTPSLLKYHWRREVLNQFGHVWIVKMKILARTTDIFSYRYSILPYQWYESYNSVHHSIMDYISQNCTDHNYGFMIRDLGFYRDSCDPHVLTAIDIVTLIEYLCTI